MVAYNTMVFKGFLAGGWLKPRALGISMIIPASINLAMMTSLCKHSYYLGVAMIVAEAVAEPWDPQKLSLEIPSIL